MSGPSQTPNNGRSSQDSLYVNVGSLDTKMKPIFYTRKNVSASLGSPDAAAEGNNDSSSSSFHTTIKEEETAADSNDDDGGNSDVVSDGDSKEKPDRETPATAPVLLSRIAQQGGGFKDAATARRTLALVAHRSLLYQQQAVRTYLVRAQAHPHAATSPGMAAAAAVFKDWQTSTLPFLQNQLRCRVGNSSGGFRPLVPKDTLKSLRPWIESSYRKIPTQRSGGWKWNLDTALPSEDMGTMAMGFLDFYVDELGARAKLGNAIIADSRGGSREQDWERLRYEALNGLVDLGKETVEGWKTEELWMQDGVTPAQEHLKVLAWAWSPVPTRTLVDKVKRMMEGAMASWM
ncbi:hypothetical protein PGQ11_009563 [Apiospora arundinis]|uniref:Uncharacterized protein n=1 Tax=Apiospora arundinis TaxID=335852 RepID=A0ABR2IIC7_9PEZI